MLISFKKKWEMSMQYCLLTIHNIRCYFGTVSLLVFYWIVPDESEKVTHSKQFEFMLKMNDGILDPWSKFENISTPSSNIFFSL